MVARALHAPAAGSRARAIRRGQWLTWATLGYNCLEGLISVIAGLLAGSVALVGFGFDSSIEVTASLAAIWRLHDDRPERRASAERRALAIIGGCFFALAAYVGVEATRALVHRTPPAGSLLGIAVAGASLIVMPLLARAKRAVARTLRSQAITAEARQTDICVYLSAILLAGLGLNALLGWWWADPLAALAMVPLIAWEGRKALQGRAGCDTCADDRSA